MPVRIKICGITRVGDALLAAQAGADAVGMVFYPSARRCVNLETARQIIAHLPPFVTPVGLFVDAEVSEIKRITEQLHLRHVQLHGHEDADVVAKLDGYVIVKSVMADRRTLAGEIAGWKQAIAQRQLSQLRGFILETPHTGQAGGSGVENDWDAVREICNEEARSGGPVSIAAGGLHPGNVGAVIGAIHPYAVDVSTGVESAPGEKSAEKIHAFVAAVRAAETK